MSESFAELVQREREKRERCWNPNLRWQVVQHTIGWVADQATVRRNTKQACLENQRRLLAAIAEYQQRQMGE